MDAIAETSSGYARIGAGNALELEDVSRSFGALHAIDGISLAVGVGERHALLGANGAGKTTLFNVVTGDFLATQGRVRFFGEMATFGEAGVSGRGEGGA